MWWAAWSVRSPKLAVMVARTLSLLVQKQVFQTRMVARNQNLAAKIVRIQSKADWAVRKLQLAEMVVQMPSKTGRTHLKQRLAQKDFWKR